MNTSIDEIQRQEQINETRKLFIAPSFDPSKYLSHEMNKVIHDPYELEKQLFDLFDSNCNNYTVLSQQIEDEVIELQESASLTESILLEELEEHAEKLSIVGDAVDDVKLNFDKASEGALRIGGRLGISEKEKNLIENGIELLGYITLFEKAGAEYYNSIASMSSEQLRRKLPEGIKDCSWGRISKVLNDLRRVVTEISSTDVDMAAKIIYSVSSVVEFELLSQFDVAINDVMEDQDNPNLLDVARELAGWLHLFNNGDSLQKTYIFTVVKRRIPDDAAFMKRGNRPSVLDRMREVVPGARSDDESSGGADDDDDDSYEEEAKAPVNFSSKQSQEAMLIQSFGTVVRQNHSSYGGNSLALLDHLSGLFTMINNVCQEQFAIIRKIFPPHTVPRVTRQLIQRVFNDPAFGIQARVDAILNPKPPNTPLPLPDYLDALVTVREKLSALYVLLLECASHPLMRGMGSESASLRQAKASSIRLAKISYSDTHKYTEGSKAEYTAQDDVEAEENMRSEAEIREFFDEQIAQVLTNYVTDYFEKEMSNVCGKFTDLLREHIDDANLLTKVGGNSRDRSKLPKIRAEKIRSITQITKTVANKNFINSIFSVTTDAVMRMESICRDDNRLPNKGKDLFLLQFSFLCDSLYTPWLKASISILLKLASGKFHQTLPPEEFLDVLSILAYGVHKVNTHLEEVFMRPLASAPNTVAVCKETRNSSFRLLDALARESLYSWAICIGVFCEKTLLNLQSKYDYSPKFDPIGNFNFGKNSSGNEGTPACSTLCKSVSKLLNAMKVKQSNLVGIDVKNHFWRPLGQLIIGILISHLKKQKISSEGVTVLLKDLEQYSNLMMIMDSPEIQDMITCLKEMTMVYRVSPDRVLKTVVEDLRYLDTEVLLAMTKARSDYGSKSQDRWSDEISIGHPTFKIDLPLPWEIKSRYTVKTFVEVVHSSHGNSRSSSLGPYSLRKAGAPVTKMFMAEVPGNADSAMSKGMSIPVDFDANGDAIPRDLDSINIRRAAAENAKASIKTSHFTPSRPDDMTTDTIDQNRLSSRITNISRPDLIGSQKPVESTKKDKRVVSGSYGTQSVPAKNGTVNGSNTIQNNGNNFKSDPNNRESTSQPSLNASVNGIGAELTSSVSPRSSAANITALISTEKVSNPLMSNSNRAVRRSSSVSPNGSPTSRPSLMQANSINIRKEMGNIFSNIGKSNSEQSSESSTALVTSPHQKQSVGRSIKPNRLMMNPLRKDSIPDLPAHLKNKLTRESQAAKDTVPPKKTTMSKMSSFFK